MMDTPAKDLLAKAKTRLVFKHPFFAVVAMRLDYVETTNIPTMATDMVRVYYNPEFVKSMTVSECAGVIMHECMHVAWLHGLRRGHRDPLIWNIATDHAINHVVIGSGGDLPRLGPNATADKPGYFCDPKYKDWSAQAIYDDLMQNTKQVSMKIRLNGDPNGDPNGGNNEGDKEDQDQGDGTPLWGEILDARDQDGKPLSSSERRELEQEIKITVKQAAQQAKARGNLPGALEGLIEATGKPKINWKEYIQQWVSGRVPDNYTWVRPNRKIMANYGIYMPRMQLNGAGVGVLSIDTSGSVSDRELKYYITEIAAVIELCSPEKLYIIQHDAAIQDIYEWNAGDEFTRLKIKGRGGTCIQPTFDQLDKFDEPVDWVICFTDMEIGDWPKEAPGIPVLWCATGEDRAPFGTYIDLRDPM